MKTNMIQSILLISLYFSCSICFAEDILAISSIADTIEIDSVESLGADSIKIKIIESSSSKQNVDTRIFLPIREMYRPLSLPPNRWKLDVGLVLIPGMKNDKFHFKYDVDLNGIQVPYIKLGEKAEFDFATPKLKYYLVKNTAIRNNRFYLEGLNLLLWTGFAGASYDTYSGFSMSWGLGHILKTVLSSDKWLYQSGSVWVTSQLGWGIGENLQIGIQISDELAIIPGINASIYSFRVYFDRSNYENYLGYTLTIPIDIKVNFSQIQGMLFRIGFAYRGNTFNSYNITNFWGIPLGFQYSWYW